MTYRLIRYRTRADDADANQERIKAVFAELEARALGDARYLVLRGSDGRFFHLVALGPGLNTSTLTSLPSFREFQRELEARCVEQPEASEVTIVGNHRMLSP